jgi:signal transduction histidine kinase
VATSRPDESGQQRADSSRHLADYAMAFDFLGRLAGATTEADVVERVFELFSALFAPSAMVYLSVCEGRPREVLSRSGPDFDLDAAKGQMLEVQTEHAWTRSGQGFDVRIGEGPTREVLRIDGVQFPDYRERYLNLALSVAPVVNLALSNARNFQLVHEEQAKLQSALRARDTTLAVVSHDLRNPVASVLVNADTLEGLVGPGRPVADERVHERVRAIRQSAARMNRLIGDLLDIRRIEAGVFTVQKTHCLVCDVMQEVLGDLRPQAEAKGVRIVDSCPARVALWCDRDRILQVLSNLVGNALKFAPRHAGVVTVDCTETETEVRFTVRDDGPGIRAEELPHVFDMYWQGREKKRLGVGLGLAIARAIVEAHGGTIGVESVPSQGATFHFAIPRPPESRR